jgi:hypothetical protein
MKKKLPGFYYKKRYKNKKGGEKVISHLPRGTAKKHIMNSRKGKK